MKAAQADNRTAASLLNARVALISMCLALGFCSTAFGQGTYRDIKMRERFCRGQESGSSKEDFCKMIGAYESMLGKAMKMPPGQEQDARLEEIRTVLSRSYFVKGDDQRCQAILEDQLKSQEKRSGPNNRRVAGCLDSLASFFVFKGEYNKAEPVFKRELKILEGSYGAASAELLDPLTKLARLYENEKKFSEAQIIWKRILNGYQDGYKRDPNMAPVVCEGLVDLSNCYRLAGRFHDAESCLAAATALDRGSVMVGCTLAQLRRDQGKNKEAALIEGKTLKDVLAVCPSDDGKRQALKTYATMLRSKHLSCQAELFENSLPKKK